MNKNIEKKINKIYEEVFKKIYNTARKENKLLNKKDILKIILRLENSEKYKKFAKKFAKELSKNALLKQRGIWKKFYNAARKKRHIILPSTYKEFELNQFKKAISHNLKMINSIPKETMEIYKYKYIETLINQVVKGSLGRGTFEKELKKSGAKRAKLIARTETAKLQTVILENRAVDLGSVCYIWRASNDKRTRESHKKMNEVIVFWRKDSEKPILDNMQGNAGEFPNCRCSTNPIFDENDLIKSNYKVYDYRIHKIINMSKMKLIECIKNGKII